MHISTPLLTGLALLAFQPVTARTYAGPVDMDKACKQQTGNSTTAYLDGISHVEPPSQAAKRGATAWSWYCATSRGAEDKSAVEVALFCRDEYGGCAYADPQGMGPYDGT
ncbi:hypothetical protein QBC39DRAFT_132658 [Podospora conica]|nr:hypothetical protein QBC39DRAFT_132658 [Schizothecium conicum]